jgi:hypothetical protein
MGKVLFLFGLACFNGKTPAFGRGLLFCFYFSGWRGTYTPTLRTLFISFVLLEMWLLGLDRFKTGNHKTSAMILVPSLWALFGVTPNQQRQLVGNPGFGSAFQGTHCASRDIDLIYP